MAVHVQIERMVKQALGVGEPTPKAASYVMDYLEGKVYIYGKEEHVKANEIIALARWASANDFTNGGEKFVQSLPDDAVSTLTSNNLTETERQYNFRKLFRHYFDVDGIGWWPKGRWPLKFGCELFGRL